MAGFLGAVSEFAKNAEGFLEKLDKSAADTFSPNVNENNSPSMSRKQLDYIPRNLSATQLALTSNQPLATPRLDSNREQKHTRSFSADIVDKAPGPLIRKADPDDLMMFLNAPTAVSEANSTETHPTSGSGGPVSRNILPIPSKSSRQSSNSTSSIILMDKSDLTSDNGKRRGSTEGSETGSSKDFQMVDTVSESSRSDTGLQYENSLLKRELQSINEEVGNLLKRLRVSEEHLGDCEKKLKDEVKQVDQLKGDIETQSNKFAITLNEKEDAIVCLNKEVSELRKKLNVSEENLKSKLSIVDLLESSVNVENQLRLKDEGRYLEEIASLTDSVSRHTASYSQVYYRCQQLENNSSESQSKLERQTAKVLELETQLQDYKQRAQRTLQFKEKVINELKEGVNMEGSGLYEEELLAVGKERDCLREELVAVNVSLDVVKDEFRLAEDQWTRDSVELRNRIALLETSVEEANAAGERYRDELAGGRGAVEIERVRSEELRRRGEELEAGNSALRGEVETLRRTLATRQWVAEGSEAEAKIRELTESLYQRQTEIEGLTAEKHSLLVRLERIGSGVRTTVSPRTQEGFPESVYDLPVTQSVKRAANSLDRFSFRLGGFFRIHPIARIFLLFYMVLLHLWVTFVLLTYQPELHRGATPSS